MKEARIVMPLVEGKQTAHTRLANRLLEIFGGCTITHGNGLWRDDAGRSIHDTVTIYDVAVNNEIGVNSSAKLYDIAIAAGRELNQQAVYIRYADGSVIVSPVPGATTPELNQLDEPVGIKRLPEVGDIWKTRDGCTVAVIRNEGPLKSHPLTCTLLNRGNSNVGWEPGQRLAVTTDGRFAGTNPHILDLTTFRSRFVD